MLPMPLPWHAPAVCAAFLSLVSLPAAAQWWLEIPAGAIPRTASGAVDLAAPAPRAPDGRPDLSGLWEPNANRYSRDLAADLKPEDVPFQPWARTLAAARADGSQSGDDPPA